MKLCGVDVVDVRGARFAVATVETRLWREAGAKLAGWSDSFVLWDEPVNEESDCLLRPDAGMKLGGAPAGPFVPLSSLMVPPRMKSSLHHVHRVGTRLRDYALVLCRNGTYCRVEIPVGKTDVLSCDRIMDGAVFRIDGSSGAWIYQCAIRLGD